MARIDALPDWFWPQDWITMDGTPSLWGCRIAPLLGQLRVQVAEDAACEVVCAVMLRRADMETRFSISAVAKLVSSRPRPYSWHEDQLEWLKLFFSIGIGQLLDFEEFFLGDTPNPHQVKLYRRPTREARWKTINHHLLPLPRPAISDPQKAIQQWFEKRKELEVPVHMLHDLWFRGRARLASELDFLALTQALEAFHRRSRPGKFNQKTRLEELAASMPAELWTRLNLPASEWVESTLKKRNALTHRGPTDSPVEVDQALIRETSRLEIVLQALLLAHIGVDEDTVMSACTRMNAWRTSGGGSWERVKIIKA